MVLLIYCCMNKENCRCCKVGGKSAMQSKLHGCRCIVTVSVAGMELLIEVKVSGGTVTLPVQLVVVTRTVRCSAL